MQLLDAMQSFYGDGSRSMHFLDIQDRDNTIAPPCDLFVSGAPCPAWSSAGVRAGLDDLQEQGRAHILLFGICRVSEAKSRDLRECAGFDVHNKC